MKFLATALFALASAAVAVAQECNGVNCFNIPPGGYQTSAGSTVNISWTPSTQGTVTLSLRSGNSAYLNNGSIIAQSIPNSGQYTWQVPTDIVRGSSYAFQITSDSDPTKVNYTPQFNIDSTVLYSSTSAGASSASAAASSSAAASVSSGLVTSAASTTASGTSSVTGSASRTSGASGSVTSAPASSTSTRATVSSSGMASRATAVAGLIGAVAFGALAL